MYLKLERYLSIWLYRFYFRYCQICGINSNSVTREVRNLCMVYVSNFTFQCFQRHISIIYSCSWEFRGSENGTHSWKCISTNSWFRNFNFLKSVSNFDLVFRSWFLQSVFLTESALSSFKLRLVRTLVKVKWRSVWIVSE